MASRLRVLQGERADRRRGRGKEREREREREKEALIDHHVIRLRARTSAPASRATRPPASRKAFGFEVWMFEVWVLGCWVRVFRIWGLGFSVELEGGG